MTEPPQRPAAPEDELSRLRAEVARLNAAVDDRARRSQRALAARRVVAAALVVLAAFGAGLSVIGVWAARTSLNTDRWVATVEPLPENAQVRAAISTFVTDEISAALQAENRVREVLPPQAAFLASPLTDRVREVVRGGVDDVLATPEFQRLWAEANRIAHSQIVDIVEGGSDALSTSDGRVTLDLLPLVNEVLRVLEQRVPTLFGRDVSLPAVTEGQVPEGLRERIESALGVTLPASFAQVTIYRSDELAALQDAAESSKRGLAGLLVATLLAAGIALLVSPDRRRTVLQLGLWLAIAVVVLTVLVRAVRTQLVESVEAGVLRTGADEGIRTVFEPLRERGYLVLALGLVLAAGAYLAGPGRGARTVRSATSSAGWRVRSWAGHLRRVAPGFARHNLDALRFGGVAVAALIALLLSSWAGLLAVLVALGAYELGVTLVSTSSEDVTIDLAGEPDVQPAEPMKAEVR